MAKLQFTENFTIEVPLSDGTNDEIKGKLLAVTPQLEKSIKLKYKDRDDKAKLNKKLQNKIERLKQKAENIQQRIPITSDENKKNQLLEDQQNILDKAYELSDELEDEINISDDNISEIICKEHIDSRVRADNENKEKLLKICEDFGYTIVWETILKDIKEGKQQDTKS